MIFLLKMHPILFYIIIVLSLSPLQLLGQDFQKDLKQIKASYKNTENLHAKFKMTSFQVDEKGQKQQVALQKTEIWKKGNNCRYDLGSMVTLLNERCLMMVNKEQELIAYRQRMEGDLEEMIEMASPNVDSIFQAYSHIEYQGEKNNQKHYRIYSEDLMIVQTDLFINKYNYQISKVIYRYNPQMYGSDFILELLFEIWDNRSLIVDNVFDESEFVEGEGLDVRATSTYSKYTFVNVDKEGN